MTYLKKKKNLQSPLDLCISFETWYKCLKQDTVRKINKHVSPWKSHTNNKPRSENQSVLF